MMYPAIKTLRSLLFGLSFVALTAAAQAQTNVWTGPIAGNWDVAANWSLGVVPQAVSIPPDPLDVSVLLDTNASQDSSVLLEGFRSIGSLQVDAGDTLTISDDATLAVGPVLNTGSIHLVGHDQSPFPSNGLRTVGTLINAPGSLLSFNNGAFSSYYPHRNYLFWNQSTTEGYGNIVNLTIQNDNLIDANVTGEQLTLQGKSLTSSSSVMRFLHNPGTMRARNGGMLRLTDWQRGDIQNHDGNGQAGTIEAWGDSTILMESVAITGGRIATSAEGGVEEGQIVFSRGVSLNGVELDALASFTKGSSLGAPHLGSSNFANKKTLSLDRETLHMSGEISLSGGGVFKLSDNAIFKSPTGGNAGQVTPKFVNVDNTILVPPGGRTVTFGEGMFVENRGIFEANGSNPFVGPSLTLDMNGPDNLATGEAAWTNSGVIRAVNGADIRFESNISDPVLANAGGVLEVDEHSRMSFYSTRIQGGIVRGPETGTTALFNYSGTTLKDVRLEGAVKWGGDLTLIGTIENAGTFKNDNAIFLASEEVAFFGGGEISLSSVESSGDNIDVPKLINVDNTLNVNNGATFDRVIFTNRGTIEANEPNSTPRMTFYNNFTRSRFNNSGVIRAIGGASLEIDNGFTIVNYELDSLGNILPGTIQAGTGSEVRLRAVSGGILQADAGGVIRVENSGSLSSLNAPTDMHLLGRIETEHIGLGGTIRNDGQLVISGDINNSGSSLSPPSPSVTLLGNGELQLNGTLLTRNSTFLNGPDHTIVGGGTILSEAGFFTNEGRIEANDSNTLTITHTGPAFLFQQRGELISSDDARLNIEGVSNWSNDGLIESRDASKINIEFEGLLTNRGSVRVALGAVTWFDGNSLDGGEQFINATGAETIVNGSLVVLDGDFVNQMGGIVTGDGEVRLQFISPEGQHFFNHGTLAPGNSVGRLTLIGDFEQSASGDLEIELGGTSSEEFDSLSAWSADLAGLLEVSLVDLGGGEFAPGLGDIFEIIAFSNGSITGEFDTFLLPTLATDLLWGIQYNPESVVLEILAPLQTDLDADGDVDGNDLLLVQRDDPSLISQWKTEYGSRVISSLASTQAVPEPSAVWLALVALASIGAVRRR